MKLTFLGTRGEIKPRSRRHYRHTATLVGYGGRRAPHAVTVRRVAELGEARGVRADVAWDGLEVVLR